MNDASRMEKTEEEEKKRRSRKGCI